MPNLTFFVAS